jgi:hypothetical protein
MKIMRSSILFLVFLQFFLWSGCGYRFVEPVQARDVSLAGIKNTTAQPRLDNLLEEALRTAGITRNSRGQKLNLAITGFTDKVSSISSAGTPIRQKVGMTVFWRLGDKDNAESVFGEESASLSYPYSPDLTTLDWNRQAAVRQLCGKIADQLRDQVGGMP